MGLIFLIIGLAVGYIFSLLIKSKPNPLVPKGMEKIAAVLEAEGIQIPKMAEEPKRIVLTVAQRWTRDFPLVMADFQKVRDCFTSCVTYSQIISATSMYWLFRNKWTLQGYGDYRPFHEYERDLRALLNDERVAVGHREIMYHNSRLELYEAGFISLAVKPIPLDYYKRTRLDYADSAAVGAQLKQNGYIPE